MAKYKIRLTYPNGDTKQLKDDFETYEAAREEVMRIIIDAFQRNDPPIISISQYANK